MRSLRRYRTPDRAAQALRGQAWTVCGISWLEQLSEVNQERRSYQRLDDALLESEEVRKTAERELDALRHRQEEMEALERDREALMVSWTMAVPDGLDHLRPEERNEIYRRLRLEIRPKEGGYEITGPFCTSEPLTY
jgi:hypothetical protein